MIKVIGISLGNKNKVYNFLANEESYKIGDFVIVETERGKEFGKVSSNIMEVEESVNTKDLYSVLYKASFNDIKKNKKNLKDSKTALLKCRELADKLELNMYIIDASYNLDRSQLMFRFMSDNRIDFRNLAKELANIYKTRIELRQMGVRDRAQEIGGYGPCGKKLCCSTFMNDFDSISINMAKTQNIALNPSKINGICGRLLCCLKYENECYKECSKGLPQLNKKILTDKGEGKVISVDVLNKSYKVNIPDVGIVEYKLNKYLLGYKDLYLVQDTEMFNFSLDSVLLPNFISIPKNAKKIIDIGCGNAPIPIILSTKCDANIIGVEIQNEVYDLAKESVFINKLDSRIEIINADINNIYKNYEHSTFDIVTCNPPYFKYIESSNINKNEYKTIARHEVCLNIELFIEK